jgi:hypothetical protein
VRDAPLLVLGAIRRSPIPTYRFYLSCLSDPLRGTLTCFSVSAARRMTTYHSALRRQVLAVARRVTAYYSAPRQQTAGLTSGNRTALVRTWADGRPITASSACATAVVPFIQNHSYFARVGRPQSYFARVGRLHSYLILKSLDVPSGDVAETRLPASIRTHSFCVQFSVLIGR